MWCGQDIKEAMTMMEDRDKWTTLTVFADHGIMGLQYYRRRKRRSDL